MRIMLLLLLLIGLVAGPVLCGPSPALATQAEHVSVTHAFDSHARDSHARDSHARDSHALDACDDQTQPPIAAGSPLVLALPPLAAVDLWLAPAAALHLLGNALTPHGAVQLRTPLRL